MRHETPRGLAHLALADEPDRRVALLLLERTRAALGIEATALQLLAQLGPVLLLSSRSAILPRAVDGVRARVEIELLPLESEEAVAAVADHAQGA